MSQRKDQNSTLSFSVLQTGKEPQDDQKNNSQDNYLATFLTKVPARQSDLFGFAQSFLEKLGYPISVHSDQATDCPICTNKNSFFSIIDFTPRLLWHFCSSCKFHGDFFHLRDSIRQKLIVKNKKLTAIVGELPYKDVVQAYSDLVQTEKSFKDWLDKVRFNRTSSPEFITAFFQSFDIRHLNAASVIDSKIGLFIKDWSNLVKRRLKNKDYTEDGFVLPLSVYPGRPVAILYVVKDRESKKLTTAVYRIDSCFADSWLWHGLEDNFSGLIDAPTVFVTPDLGLYLQLKAVFQSYEEFCPVVYAWPNTQRRPLFFQRKNICVVTRSPWMIPAAKLAWYLDATMAIVRIGQEIDLVNVVNSLLEETERQAKNRYDAIAWTITKVFRRKSRLGKHLIENLLDFLEIDRNQADRIVLTARRHGWSRTAKFLTRWIPRDDLWEQTRKLMNTKDGIVNRSNGKLVANFTMSCVRCLKVEASTSKKSQNGLFFYTADLRINGRRSIVRFRAESKNVGKTILKKLEKKGFDVSGFRNHAKTINDYFEKKTAHLPVTTLDWYGPTRNLLVGNAAINAKGHWLYCNRNSYLDFYPNIAKYVGDPPEKTCEVIQKLTQQLDSNPTGLLLLVTTWFLLGRSAVSAFSGTGLNGCIIRSYDDKFGEVMLQSGIFSEEQSTNYKDLQKDVCWPKLIDSASVVTSFLNSHNVAVRCDTINAIIMFVQTTSDMLDTTKVAQSREVLKHNPAYSELILQTLPDFLSHVVAGHTKKMFGETVGMLVKRLIQDFVSKRATDPVRDRVHAVVDAVVLVTDEDRLNAFVEFLNAAILFRSDLINLDYKGNQLSYVEIHYDLAHLLPINFDYIDWERVKQLLCRNGFTCVNSNDKKQMIFCKKEK